MANQMNLWTFLDTQLERVERNGFGVSLGCLMFCLLVLIPVLLILIGPTPH